MSKSWTVNLTLQGVFYDDPEWYDNHLRQKMPLYDTMLKNVILALPPVRDAKACDLLCGSGFLAVELIKAVPSVKLNLIDKDERRMDMAMLRVKQAQASLLRSPEPSSTLQNIDLQAPMLPGGPYDLIVSSLGLHGLAGQCDTNKTSPHSSSSHASSSHASSSHASSSHSHGDKAEGKDGSAKEQKQEKAPATDRYVALFKFLLESLTPGGHLIFGDHIGSLPLFQQLCCMQKAGFVDVDVAWRGEFLFVAGGRRPAEAESQ